MWRTRLLTSGVPALLLITDETAERTEETPDSMMSPTFVSAVVVWAATRALRPERMMVAARIVAVYLFVWVDWYT